MREDMIHHPRKNKKIFHMSSNNIDYKILVQNKIGFEKGSY
jgi:hypothetical protein